MRKLLLIVCIVFLPVTAEARCWGANGYCTKRAREQDYYEAVERRHRIERDAIERNSKKPGADVNYYKDILKRLDSDPGSGTSK